MSVVVFVTVAALAASLVPRAEAQAITDVRLDAGEDFQAAVDALPPGTRFVIAAGVHRGQSVRPKDGMVFTGEPGAVMSGAVVLTGFSADGDAWAVSGRHWRVRHNDVGHNHGGGIGIGPGSRVAQQRAPQRPDRRGR